MHRVSREHISVIKPGLQISPPHRGQQLQGVYRTLLGLVSLPKENRGLVPSFQAFAFCPELLTVHHDPSRRSWEGPSCSRGGADTRSPPVPHWPTPRPASSTAPIWMAPGFAASTTWSWAHRGTAGGHTAGHTAGLRPPARASVARRRPMDRCCSRSPRPSRGVFEALTVAFVLAPRPLAHRFFPRRFGGHREAEAVGGSGREGDRREGGGVERGWGRGRVAGP